MAARYSIHRFVDIAMCTVELFLVLGFRIHGPGAIRLRLSIMIEQRVVSGRRGVSLHVMRPLSIVIIWVVSVHVSSLGFDQALFTPQIIAPLQAIVVSFGMSAMGVRASTMSVVGRRCLWTVAVCPGIDIATATALRGFAKGAARFLTAWRGLPRPLRKRHGVWWSFSDLRPSTGSQSLLTMVSKILWVVRCLEHISGINTKECAICRSTRGIRVGLLGSEIPRESQIFRYAGQWIQESRLGR